MTNFMFISGMIKDPTDYVGFTLWLWLWWLHLHFSYRWASLTKNGVPLVSGLITFIAAVHYFYMRDYWATFGESPTFSVMLTGYWRLMCLEFYLILKVAGAKQFCYGKWLSILLSLVTGYFGEVVDPVTQHFGDSSGVAYF
jgi:hypothetical protein